MFESVTVGFRQPAQALVVGIFSDKRLDPGLKQLDARFGGAIGAAIARPECTGDSGRIAEAFPASHGPGAAPRSRARKAGSSESVTRIIIVGLGKREAFLPGSLRAVAGAVGRRLAQTKEQRVEVDLGPAIASAKADPAFAGRAFGEGLGLVAWSYDKNKGTGSDKPARHPIAVRSQGSAFQHGLETGLQLAASTNIARDLSQTPPNIATTSYIAQQARALARRTGMDCRVISGAALEDERLIGLLNVGKASESKPCLIRLEYRPGRARRSKPAVIIGKTMTYDTGGLSLKINNGMVGMKRDKDGGCAVLGAMHAVATYVRPQRPVVALLSVAENSISDNAYRPDDCITFRNGVTVEVTNTDAEGRLVLADALCWACDKENPEFIIDLATLTGGVVTALGSTFAGLWCDNDRLRTRLENAMETSGERWWRMPHDQEYREMMKSPIADIVNSNPNRKAHPIQGAAFLSYFVKPEIPWAHIDIAGVHAVEADSGCFSKGPTGWGVRLLADLLDQD
jgi:leucyl aminopeptidase